MRTRALRIISGLGGVVAILAITPTITPTITPSVGFTSSLRHLP